MQYYKLKQRTSMDLDLSLDHRKSYPTQTHDSLMRCWSG